MPLLLATTTTISFPSPSSECHCDCHCRLLDWCRWSLNHCLQSLNHCNQIANVGWQTTAVEPTPTPAGSLLLIAKLLPPIAATTILSGVFWKKYIIFSRISLSTKYRNGSFLGIICKISGNLIYISNASKTHACPGVKNHYAYQTPPKKFEY